MVIARTVITTWELNRQPGMTRAWEPHLTVLICRLWYHQCESDEKQRLVNEPRWKDRKEAGVPETG